MAAERPETLAAADDSGQLSYRELDVAAGRLAARLRAEGVDHGDMVAVVLDRGVDLVVAQVAILRAGATIVPLDPVNPPARLGRMLDRAAPRAIITGHPDRLPTTDTRVLTADWPPGETLEPVPVHPDQLAYVTYTSGSTGEPKGVMITHRSLTATVAWSRDLLGLQPADRNGMTASPGFDVSVLDTFTALTAGASVHAPDGALLTSPADLRNWLRDKEITVTFLPTPVAEPLLEVDWEPDCPLRLLQVGGAVLHRHPRDAVPFQVLNLYGVTEVGVWSTGGLVEPGLTGTPSVGRPVDGAEVLVLDGEVFLGGVGVARGYLGRPGLTADRFVPHPSVPGARLYRTGDRAAWGPGGELEFTGRTDHQVQGSGGVRIELGEIEAALVTYPAVGQAAVTVHEGRIVGYVTGEVDVDELRAHVADQLPRYMVPDDFVVLERFPLTPTGKIDRMGLPAPKGRTSSAPFEPPSTPLQRQLARIWQDVLGVDRVSVHDSFFDIGGNSMSLVRVFGHLTTIASHEVTLVELYQFPTIAGFAEHLEATTEAQAPQRNRDNRARLRRTRLEESRG
ncbi:non-ribosomal peptide synthetase [Actinocrispum wychmicini]|uniref:non-ribosomal peptide synthetase n=1 Tax=Actinocrispum wychmicini TaxID=1213861 RepID=UPI0014051A35|nr:non-ribosomal peptide synthetase [Actinocrispum wychmicini]